MSGPNENAGQPQIGATIQPLASSNVNAANTGAPRRPNRRGNGPTAGGSRGVTRNRSGPMQTSAPLRGVGRNRSGPMTRGITRNKSGPRRGVNRTASKTRALPLRTNSFHRSVPDRASSTSSLRNFRRQQNTTTGHSPIQQTQNADFSVASSQTKDSILVRKSQISGIPIHDARNGVYNHDTTSLFVYRGCDNSDGDIVPLTNNESKTLKSVGDILLRCAVLLNASSKWLLTIANLYGVIRYREPAAFLCIGCILAFFGTEHLLKPLWNQARPACAPRADPGMPSSHSLGSFFACFAWVHILQGVEGGDPTALLLGISSIIASLRIVCGYHTIAQVVVGAILGLVLGDGWMKLVWFGFDLKALMYAHPTLRCLLWLTYGSGTLIFIWKMISKVLANAGKMKSIRRLPTVNHQIV